MNAAVRPALVLAVLDGWGHSDQRHGNAILACPSDHIQRLSHAHPCALVEASGNAVGLPDGVMGNSEVGHITIGSGRIIEQDLTQINRVMGSGRVEGNDVIDDAFRAASSGTLHFLGLASDAGVHSDLAHLRVLVQEAGRAGVQRIRVHAFTDGRDTPPDSGAGYIRELAAFLDGTGIDARIATLSGRYYAMDRDNRWERVEQAWKALVLGEGRPAGSPESALELAAEAGETDEFIQPSVIRDVPHGRIASGDVVFFFNFRPDRARQMTYALTRDDFDGFDRPQRPDIRHYVCMTSYDEALDLPVAFRSQPPDTVLGSLFSGAGQHQVRIAETEKYAHVTYFLNGGVERPFPGEDRILVPSPRVATYDLQPEMSAPEVARRVTEQIEAGKSDVIVVNFANADMVGHTGDYAATVRACEVVDRAVGQIHAACRARGSLLVVTADHGNAEQMLDARGRPHTAHTTNPVPVIFARDDLAGKKPDARGQGLSSVLPSALALLGMTVPAGMGKPLLS